MNGEMQDVLITIKSTQALGGEKETAEFITQGKYRKEGDEVCFYYMETGLTGLDGTRACFNVKPDEVILSRTGTVSSEMIFRRGEKHPFEYRTLFGNLTMDLDTFKVSHALGEKGGDMVIEYDIDLDREVISRNRFVVNVKLKGN